MKIPPKFVSAATALLTALVLAGGAGAQQATKPKLIVAIAVDQLSADLFAEYRPHFTGGLQRLSREGVVFPSGYQSHAATETCPGHSTILTGSRPNRTGIVANDWYDLRVRPADSIYCAEDETVPGSSSSNRTISAVHLKVPTLGERLKATDPTSQSVAVAGKDRAAAMMGGQFKNVDQVWWWKSSAKAFVGPPTQTPSAVVATVHAQVAAQLATPQPALSVPAICQAREREVTVQQGLSVGTHRFARAAGQEGPFRASPELDRLTLALAAALLDDLKLGVDSTDVLAISLSATDYVGHTYGTAGVEMCLQLLALDRELGSFFAKLDATGIDYVVVLTADHGGHDLPERNREQAAVTADRADDRLDTKKVGEKIAQDMGLSGPALYGLGPSGDIYVDPALSAENKAEVLKRAKKIYDTPQVAAVFTHAELQHLQRPQGPPDTWSLAERVWASFDCKRSGDLVVLLQPRVTPIPTPGPGYVATHGSPWDYDRRVPILFWRKGLTPFEQPLAVETVDILPTLAALLQLPIPAGEIDGRCLDLKAGQDSICP